MIRPLLLLALAGVAPGTSLGPDSRIALVWGPSVVAAQEAPAAPVPTYPFGVGERFQYQVKLGLFSVGRATMQVVGLDSVRGHETFVFRFTLNGKALFFSLDDTLTSWTGTADFHSFRFIQENNEDGKSRTREFEIYPDSAKFRYNGLDSLRPSVHDPLDDTGFFYWVRTLPLEVGQSYSWDRYFKLDRNPVRIRVLKRQSCELPGDRKRRCLLIQPSIKSNGMLGESSDARILLTDDADRIPVEVRSNFSFGTLVLKLRQVRLASDTTVTWR